MRAAPDLALYHYETCGYCWRVRLALRMLDVEVELRDVRREPRYAAELEAARGRGTVPVLRVEKDDGRVEWLAESRDIVRYLESRFR